MSILEALTPTANPEVSYSKWMRQRFSMRVLHIQIERAKKNGRVSETRKRKKALKELTKENRNMTTQLFLRNLIKA